MATVLVVDDEPQVSTMVARLLEREGFAVFTAGCGSEAISLCSSHPGTIDLLITDIEMPGMDGPSLATALKSVNPDLAVLLMSGNWESTRIGSDFAFLPKPFSISALLATVRRLIGNRHATA